jgi:hypothetical protein
MNSTHKFNSLTLKYLLYFFQYLDQLLICEDKPLFSCKNSRSFDPKKDKLIAECANNGARFDYWVDWETGKVEFEL